MLNQNALSISTAGKCAPMQVVKQPGLGRALTTEEQTSTSVTLICCAKTFKTIHEAQKPK